MHHTNMHAEDEQAGSRTPAINIASRITQDADYGDDHDLVGSPEQVSELATYRSSPHLPFGYGSQDALPSRPGFGRSISSPQGISSMPTSSSPRFQTLFRKTQRPPKDREWSVFGELMSGEGRGERHLQVPSFSASSSFVRRGGHTPSSSTTPIPTPAMEESGTLSLGDTVQSPVQDSQMAGTDNLPSFSSMEQVSEPQTLNDRHSHSDSDSDHDENGTQSRPVQRSWQSFLPSLPTLTPMHKNILKCSVAYFIGSLFTFSPYLSGFVADVTGNEPGDTRPSPSGHMVATVAVYFNPAKTVGGMLEADTFCLMGLLYAAFVSLSSMGMFWFFEVRSGWEWLADSLVILWIGLGMSAVAWTKLWMAKPAFNPACSMTAIILFVVIIKEGGIDTLLEVSFIVLVGALISNLVCYTLWPQQATNNLQNTMSKTLDSFSTLLTTITHTFTLEEPVRQPSQEKLKKAIDGHQASFTALRKHLAEAQSERWFGGPGKSSTAPSRENLGQAYEDAVDSLNRLGQHLNGLRSGTSLQFELIQANKEGKLTLKNRTLRAASGLPPAVSSSGTIKDKGIPTAPTDDDLLQAAAEVFENLLDDLDSPIKSLASTCSSTLKRLKEAFVPSTKSDKLGKLNTAEFAQLSESLERALFQFESTSNHAIVRLYRKGTGSSRMSITSLSDSENPYMADNDSENIFLIYFFIFTLQEFAKELASLVDAMGRIYSIQRIEAEQKRWWRSLFRPLIYMRGRISDTCQNVRRREKTTPQKRLSKWLPEPKPNTVSFPKVKPHAPNTVQTPPRETLTFWGRLKQSLWAIGARLKEPDMKYSFKTGMALAILAAPAFFESTRPIFTEYRGEWALISFFVVMSPTVGATNSLGMHRVLGTLLGAVIAVCVWSLFPENPYVLAIFGFFYSIPCFYYIVAKPQYATSSRFVLLTYNLTCLYCYNLREKDISVINIGYHRFVAVTIGVVWAAIVSRYWWPYEARRELSKALGEFCLNIGWLYTRLVAFNSWEHDTSVIEEEQPTEETSLLIRSKNAHLNESIVRFMAMELHLQIKLIQLQGLLSQTQHEPRLKGPFPVKLYRSILTSLQTILDKLHSMRCVTSRDEWHTTVRKEFIIPVNKERRDMVGNVILYFSTLAAAFRLKSPLPPYLPPAEEARQRLVDAIRQLDVAKNRDVKGSRHLLFFAYATTMKGVIHELDYLGRTVQDAFGVIGGSTEEFEAMFRDALA